DQAPSVVELDPHAVDINDRVVPAEILRRAAHDLEFTIIGTIEPDLGSGTHGWQIRQNRTEAELLVAYDFEQPEGRVDGVIETEIAVCEEHMSAHLAGKRGILGLELVLEE